VLGVEGIGITGFIESFSRYFLLFAVAGIPIYGMREIARRRDDTTSVNRAFTEIFSIQFYLSIIATVIYLVSLLFLKDFDEFRVLYFMGGFLIFSNIFSLEWVFQGLEDFKFITLRTIFIRALTILLLFLIVKTREDYIWYFFLLIFSSTANGIVNFLHVKKYFRTTLTVSYQRIKGHLKPIALTGGYLFAISIYTLLTTVLLGFISSDEAVGYYTVAIKFNRIALGVFSALSTVLIPKLSNIAANDDKEAYQALINKSISFVLTLGFPIAISIFLLAPELISLFAGPGYEASVICVQVMSPVVLITAMAQIFGPQILIPFSRDKQNIISVSIGACLSLLANLILIPLFNELGASISTVVVELIVALITLFYALRVINMHINTRELVIRILLIFPFFLIALICRNFFSSDFTILISYGVAGFLYFIIIETVILKDPLFSKALKIKSRSES